MKSSSLYNHLPPPSSPLSHHEIAHLECLSGEISSYYFTVVSIFLTIDFGRAKNITSGSSVELVLSQDLRITNIAISDDYKDALGRTSLVLSSTRNNANSISQSFTIANLLVARTEQVLVNVKLDQGYKYILSCRGSNDLTLLGYYERNLFNLPGGTNFNPSVNPAHRTVASTLATSTSAPTNGATSTSTSSRTSSAAQSSLSNHRPIAGRVTQKSPAIPAAGWSHTAIANAPKTGPYSTAIVSQISDPGDGNTTPCSFDSSTNEKPGTYDMRVSSGGFINNFPSSSNSNAGPATSDRVSAHQLTRPNSTSSLSGHGQKRRTIDTAENVVVTSSATQTKRMKTATITQGPYNPTPTHETASHEQYKHYPSSGPSNGALLPGTNSAPNCGSASEQRSSRPSFSSNHAHMPFSGTTPASNHDPEQRNRPSSSSQSSILFSSSHAHTPFKGPAPGPNHDPEQLNHPSSGLSSIPFSASYAQTPFRGPTPAPSYGPEPAHRPSSSGQPSVPFSSNHATPAPNRESASDQHNQPSSSGQLSSSHVRTQLPSQAPSLGPGNKTSSSSACAPSSAVA
ncbi:hypothetical protein F5051DRAFT_444051 [Lentinula edodes]|nr:hypothetical protein F5051DRAFT_444051 [Lentinula edodes]